MSCARQSFVVDELPENPEEEEMHFHTFNWEEPEHNIPAAGKPIFKRVSTKRSPQMKAYYNQHVNTLDSVAEIIMICASTASRFEVDIQKSNQIALQADSKTPLEIIGETHFGVTRDNVTLHIEALVVKDLDVEFLGGISFISNNDISIRPTKHEIMVGDSNTILNYNIHIQSRRGHQVSVSCSPHPGTRSSCPIYHNLAWITH